MSLLERDVYKRQGVDSSVVVWEFAQLGLHPDCFYIKIGPEEKEEWDCSSELVLKAPTGSGKTYMTQKMIGEMAEQPDWDREVALSLIHISS